MRHTLLPMGMLRLLKHGSASCGLGKMLRLYCMQGALVTCIGSVLVWGWSALGWPLNW